MFGAYQAGAWKALAPVFQPDVVIGSSVGSINGWAIASGIPPDALVRTWVDRRCAKLMCRLDARRPWHPYFDPEPLREMIQELTARYTPKVPFALVVTRLPQLRPEVIQTPHITWQHILASAAVPIGYPAVRINGQLYCDGGLLSVLPVWAAQSFGVERAIAVNVLPSKPLTLLRATLRMVRLLAPREPQANGLEVLRLTPDPPLGRWQDAITWDPVVVQRWIERGQAEAEALIRTFGFD
jgi:predicted acylesterase/phospholipase RssA